MNNIIDMPTLYKKTNTGAIQYWRIGYKQSVIDGSTVGSVHTEYGQLNTDKPQVTVDVIREGKNLGRSNETTPYSQAMAEAKQKWDKQIKKGYSEDMDKAEAGDKGLPGIDPMLAHTWEKHGAKFHFPGFVQPKLDGLRAICVIENSKARFYSRTRKEFLTVPHLQRQIQNLCHLNGIIGGVVFDGELYSHELKHDFNKIISIVKRDEVHEDVEKIEYHIYDLPSQHGAGFDGRWTTLKSFFGCMPKSAVLNLKLVRTEPVADKEKLKEFFEKCLKNGYEGAMLRDADLPYENKRSKGLIKYKEFQDDEYEIVGVEEGKGKLMGHAGSFVCRLPDGSTFNAKLKGETEGLKEYFVNFDKKYKGAMLTVQYFNMTPDGKPRFPVGLRVRQEE